MGYEIRNKKQRVEVRRVYDVTCDQCNRKLKPVLGAVNVDEDGGWSHLQAEDALEVELHGYYGGFIDPHAKVSVLLCKTCAELMCGTFPCLNNAIKEAY